MIIDKNDLRFADVPTTLEGDVLLEEVKDGAGATLGYITAPAETVRALKGKTNAKLKQLGWFKYKKIINSI